MASRNVKTIGIAGGGMIGLCCAWYLRQAGHEVTVFDASDFTDNCSQGNAGYVTPSHFIPLASPGIFAQGLRWMFDKRSPFYIRPSLDRKLLYWGWKFYRHSTYRHVQQAKVPLKDINLLSRALFLDLVKEIGFRFELHEKGCLMLCKTETVLKHEVELIPMAAAIGIQAVSVRKAELHKYIPGTETEAAGGVFFSQDMHLDPPAFVAGLRKALVAKGVSLVSHAQVHFRRSAAGNIASLVANGLSKKFDIYVDAAGSKSGELAAALGFRLPLQGGKGYSFTTIHENTIFDTPVILVERRVAISPLDSYTRYGGTLEIDGHRKRVNYQRVEGIVNTVNQYFPGLSLASPPLEQVWYGYRPCSPDGLPYIGRAGNISNLFIATGHAMMGFGLGPATGKLLAEMISGAAPSIDVRAFNPGRFA